jgi:hypothetical protein
MKELMLITLLMTPFMQQKTPETIELRHSYLQAVLKEPASKELSRLTEEVKPADDPILVCYKGVALMISAKYGNNPFAKLKRFNNGKTLMEGAIARDSDNVEMRYLRYAIQKSVPEFLGYHKNQAADEYFLNSKLLTIKDEELKGMVLQVLSNPIAQKK